MLAASLAPPALAQQVPLKGEVVDMSLSADCEIQRGDEILRAAIGTRLYAGDQVVLKNYYDASVTLLMFSAFRFVLNGESPSYVVPAQPNLELILANWGQIVEEAGDGLSKVRKPKKTRPPVQTMSGAQVAPDTNWGAVVGYTDAVAADGDIFTTWVLAAPSEEELLDVSAVYFITQPSVSAARAVLSRDADVDIITSSAGVSSDPPSADQEVTGVAYAPEQAVRTRSFLGFVREQPLTYYVRSADDGAPYNVRAVNVPSRRLPDPPWGEAPHLSADPVEQMAYAYWLSVHESSQWDLESAVRFAHAAGGADLPDDVRLAMARLLDE
jgi:hypothetical protein